MPGALLDVADDPRHAGLHVVEQMAVKKPVARFIRLKLNRRPAHRRHVHRVLERREGILPVEQPEKMPVQMQRVVHHRVVDELNAKHLPALDSDGRVLAQGLVIESP